MRLHRGHSWLHHRHIVDNGCGAQTTHCTDTLHRHTTQILTHRYWRRQRSHGKPPHSKLGHQNFLQPMQCWGGDKVTKVINIIETSSGKMLGNFTKIIRLCQFVARIPPRPRSNPETEDFYYFLWFSLFLVIVIFIISCDCDFHYFLWFLLTFIISWEARCWAIIFNRRLSTVIKVTRE